jgi:hypothetical protein
VAPDRTRRVDRRAGRYRRLRRRRILQVSPHSTGALQRGITE